jgi:BMFP domain-containing protein YqiC
VTQPSIDLGEILEELDELGRAKFDAALERVKNRKLQARIDELEARESGEAERK